MRLVAGCAGAFSNRSMMIRVVAQQFGHISQRTPISGLHRFAMAFQAEFRLGFTLQVRQLGEMRIVALCASAALGHGAVNVVGFLHEMFDAIVTGIAEIRGILQKLKLMVGGMRIVARCAAILKGFMLVAGGKTLWRQLFMAILAELILRLGQQSRNRTRV